MPSSVFDMKSDHFRVGENFKQKIRSYWGDERKVLEATVEELYEATTYEGLAGEPCSRMSRNMFALHAAMAGFVLGQVKTPEEFFTNLEKKLNARELRML